MLQAAYDAACPMMHMRKNDRDERMLERKSPSDPCRGLVARRPYPRTNTTRFVHANNEAKAQHAVSHNGQPQQNRMKQPSPVTPYSHPGLSLSYGELLSFDGLLASADQNFYSAASNPSMWGE